MVVRAIGLEETGASELGVDCDEYLRLMRGLVPDDWDQVCDVLLHPLKLAAYPLPLARFGLSAIQSARSLINSNFRERFARGAMAGVAAHSALKLEDIASASFAVVLGLAAHAVGWPIPRGGSQRDHERTDIVYGIAWAVRLLSPPPWTD